ncbi:unnamed protein product [Anisakis simplex]|uniref:Purine nucleoside phosphorylase n=1 Tax=Anisakis simplex TaxID=6269 RepID=A0A0M3JK60_ANISI|nr:unnamed protein product [Anisakis simplex]
MAQAVPIYKGSAEPLIAMTGKTHNDEYFFGPDGLGGKPDNFPKVIPEDFENYDHSKPAALALIDLFKRNPDVTLVAIGQFQSIYANFIRFSIPSESFGWISF